MSDYCRAILQDSQQLRGELRKQFEWEEQPDYWPPTYTHPDIIDDGADITVVLAKTHGQARRRQAQLSDRINCEGLDVLGLREQEEGEEGEEGEP
jgi:hypothetical protein